MKPKSFELEETVSEDEFKAIQKVMSQISSDQFLQEAELPKWNVERMKSIVSETYKKHHNIVISPEKLDLYFAPYMQENAEKQLMTVEPKIEGEENVPLNVESNSNTRGLRNTSVLRLTPFQKISIHLFGRYFSFQLNQFDSGKKDSIIYDHLPLSDEDIVEEVNHILDIDKKDSSPVFTTTCIVFCLCFIMMSGALYGFMFAKVMFFICFFIMGGLMLSLAIRTLNHKKLRLGLLSLKAGQKETTACRVMFDMIQPLNHRCDFDTFKTLPDLTEISNKELRDLILCYSPKKISVLKYWIKTGKPIRKYELELLRKL